MSEDEFNLDDVVQPGDIVTNGYHRHIVLFVDAAQHHMDEGKCTVTLLLAGSDGYYSGDLTTKVGNVTVLRAFEKVFELREFTREAFERAILGYQILRPMYHVVSDGGKLS